MDAFRRRLLQFLSAPTVGSAVAGCPAGYRNPCTRAEDSLDATVPESTGGVGPLSDAWPMRHNDAGTTGYAAASGPERDVERRRLFAGPGSFYPSVVVGDGRLYVTSRAGRLLAVDPAEPRVDWRYDEVSEGGATAAVADGLVLVAARNGLHALDAATGDVRWRRDEQFDAEELLLVADGTAYAATPDGILAVDVATGEVARRITAESLGAVADGRLYLATGNGLAVASVDGGPILWRDEEVEGDAVAVSDGTAYVAGGAQWGHLREDPGVLEAFDAADGTRKWTFDSEKTQGLLAPAVAPDAVVVSDGYGSTVHVLDRADGQRRWCANFGSGHVTTTVVTDDVCYVIAGAAVQARRLEGGEPLWTHRTPSEEQLGAEGDEPEFYHQHALVDGVLLAAGYGRPGVVVDAFVER